MSGAAPWALVPVKRMAAAKQRLAAVLDAGARRELALAMAEDVLAALASVPALAGIAMVTNDTDARALARRFGARVLSEAADDGYTEAVEAGAAALRRDGARSVLVLPGDVPGATPSEIAALIAAHDPSPAFTIVPAHDRMGTNAVLRSPPDSVALRFGADSFARHLVAARHAGIAPRVVALPGIARDLDTVEDLLAFAASAGRTRTGAVLAGLGAVMLAAPCLDSSSRAADRRRGDPVFRAAPPTTGLLRHSVPRNDESEPAAFIGPQR